METPIRPWTRIRRIGHWRSRGDVCSAEVGLKRSSSKARARCVKTTRRDAMPRRPWDQLSVAVVEEWLECISGEAARRIYIYPFDVFLSNAHSASSPIYLSEEFNASNDRENGLDGEDGVVRRGQS
jgi:hypothetical protein